METGMAATARFTLTSRELSRIAGEAPGLILPSFATHEHGAEDSARRQRTAEPATDQRLFLALALLASPVAIVQLVSWSPGVVVRRSIAVTGAVASSLTRRDDAGAGIAAGGAPGYEAALFPTSGLVSEVVSTARVLGVGTAATSGFVSVPIASTRAVIEAARRGDPALTAAVAAQLQVPASTIEALDGLQGRFSGGVRIRLFDGRSGRCLQGGDWVGTDRGWRRLRLDLPAGPGSATAHRVAEEGTVEVAPVTGESIRRSLGWMLAALISATIR